jgi:hypothetical protein
MKRLTIDEVYLLSEIADKIDINVDMPDVKGKSDKEIELMQEQLGKKLMLQMFRKMHKAKAEISELIKMVTGKEASLLNIKELKENITEILRQEGIMDFFK